MQKLKVCLLVGVCLFVANSIFTMNKDVQSQNPNQNKKVSLQALMLKALQGSRHWPFYIEAYLGESNDKTIFFKLTSVCWNGKGSFSCDRETKLITNLSESN